MFLEKEYLTVDGHKLGLIIEGTDRTNPVILFLHGGPGFPQYPMIKSFNLEWSQYATICYWDQRGAGMSYNAKTQGVLEMERYISDTIEVTKYLKKKFVQEKIYLFGHSWGSIIGSLTAYQFPEHYHAYIGSGQVGRMLESNRETHQFLLNTALAKRDNKAEEQIRSVTIDEDYYKNEAYGKLLSRYLIKYGGGMKRYNYSLLKGILEVFKCKQYSIKERINFPKGLFTTYQAVSEFMGKFDAVKATGQFDLPIYIIHGEYDYQTSFNEARRFFDSIEAPAKKLYKFTDCAHSPFVEKPADFLEILKNEILVN
ncbi:hypothetical protein AJ85_17980 [Alkalihalobacillus alcalophilus ATCC 27647 = CGMCC 1.3604]|uniref:prolyl aminopeptidase n=1 Tax=Alkalihalobacillus alcalophilus ATCC 27647 = CGMCC 1.3604 TaxID=1218173 RepID=A0A094XD17_ALKAL|nr:alpha/beta hydrolase [Alkalihalobacillus alcalophilus]KGA96680.1 hypothetical protein BALCAV_0214710 [Alkalihalobacillus alcalophilus ATCC 27647 = CGMCC 1.3604]MED1562389.1 alpha/beta hydrolase [Alkalihalobacillus alcalophilus]THG89397.1 hypothetical protein AJ85_17980 [Alkalihalobacillus alcalophilus ATCC 27647 = CGMCC 1.3604]